MIVKDLYHSKNKLFEKGEVVEIDDVLFDDSLDKDDIDMITKPIIVQRIIPWNPEPSAIEITNESYIYIDGLSEKERLTVIERIAKGKFN